MALSRSNGTTDIEQNKFFRSNGTTDIQIGKMFRSNGTTDSLIYNSAPEWLFQNGELNTEYIEGFSNGLSGAEGTGDTSSYKSETINVVSSPAADLSGLTGLRITGEFNVRASSHGSGTANGSVKLNLSDGTTFTLFESEVAYVDTGTKWKSGSFDKTIPATFSEEEILTFVMRCAYSANPTYGNAYMEWNITGIYPIE